MTREELIEWLKKEIEQEYVLCSIGAFTEGFIDHLEQLINKVR